LFTLYLPHVRSLFVSRNPILLKKGVELASHIVNLWCEPSGLTAGLLPNTTHLFELVQAIIDFMVKCPEQTTRTFSLKTMQEYLSVLDDETRMDILETLLEKCPYNTVIATIIHIVTEEVNKAWVARTKDKSFNSPFISTKIISMLETLLKPVDVLNRVDILISSLNFLLFILLRDRTANIIGLWESLLLNKLRENSLTPLQSLVRQMIGESIKEAESSDKAKKTMKEIQQHGLPPLSQQQLQTAQQQNITNLQLVYNLLDRVFTITSSETKS